MKLIIKQLQKQLLKLRKLVQIREDYVINRSERWQESAKCEDYEDKTWNIESQADELDSIIDNLKD